MSLLVRAATSSRRQCRRTQYGSPAESVTGAVNTPNFITDDPMHPTGGPQYLEFGPELAMTDIAAAACSGSTRLRARTISTLLLDNPEGVAYASNGDLYVAQRISDNVLRFPSAADPARRSSDGRVGEASPADLEFGPNGLLYLSGPDKISSLRCERRQWRLRRQLWDGRRVLVFTPVPEPRNCRGMSLIAALCLGRVQTRR